MTYRGSIKALAESWCVKNKILIYATAITNTQCKIIVNFKGKEIVGDKLYKSKNIKATDDKWWEEITRLRIIYYEKHLEKVSE